MSHPPCNALQNFDRDSPELLGLVSIVLATLAWAIAVNVANSLFWLVCNRLNWLELAVTTLQLQKPSSSPS
jgi:hypothetical protein